MMWMLLAPSVYLTVDMWSSRDMRSYIGITSHFVVDFVLESQMVTCKRLRGSHTADDDDPEGNDIIQPIVTDHFGQLPYEEIGCFAHTLQLTVNDGLKDAGQMKTVILKVKSLVPHVCASVMQRH